MPAHSRVSTQGKIDCYAITKVVKIHYGLSSRYYLALPLLFSISWQGAFSVTLSTIFGSPKFRPPNTGSVDPAFDELIRDQFAAVHGQANRGELFQWRREPIGRLAEIVVLDQFSRNMHRGKADAFASDALALVLAKEAVAACAVDILPALKDGDSYGAAR